MINSVVEKIRLSVAGLAFVSKSAGIVREQVKDKLRFPVISVDDSCSGDYTDVLPNSKENCIVFFELLSNNAQETSMHRVKFSAEIKTCVWLNTNRFDQVNIDLVAAHITKRILKTNFSGLAAYVKAPLVELSSGIDYKNPYSKYTIDENKSQYLMKPYAGFSVNFKVDYYYVYDCLPSINLSENLC